jgi:uncharacterized protein
VACTIDSNFEFRGHNTDFVDAGLLSTRADQPGSWQRKTREAAEAGLPKECRSVPKIPNPLKPKGLRSIKEKDISSGEGLISRSPNMAERRTGPMKKRHPDIPRELIEDFCRRHHITKLSIFGSYLRDDFRPDSDIDFLVEFDPKHIPTLFDVAGMEIELSELLGGRKVDLRTPQDLSRYFRDEVVAHAEVQYAEG